MFSPASTRTCISPSGAASARRPTTVRRMRGMRIKLTLLLVLLALPLAAQDFARDIDKAVADALAKSGAPSASVAVIKDGKIAYVHAYGSARLAPSMAATPEMRYSIGSVS